MARQFFPLINRTAVYVLCALVLVGWAFVIAIALIGAHGGAPGEVFTKAYGSALHNPLRVLVRTGLTTLLLAGCLLWMWNGVVVDASGIALRLWGRLRWRMGWEELWGWCWEEDLSGNQTGLLLHDRQGHRRAIRMLLYGSRYHRRALTSFEMRHTYAPLLRAIREHVPDLPRLPDEKVRPSELRDWPMYLLAALVLLGFTMVLIWGATIGD